MQTLAEHEPMTATLCHQHCPTRHLLATGSGWPTMSSTEDHPRRQNPRRPLAGFRGITLLSFFAKRALVEGRLNDCSADNAAIRIFFQRTADSPMRTFKARLCSFEIGVNRCLSLFTRCPFSKQKLDDPTVQNTRRFFEALMNSAQQA